MSTPAQTFTTVRDLLRYAVSRFHGAGLFFGHGSDNPVDEAVFLLLHTLALPIDRIEPFLDARLLPEEIERVLSLIERRAEERIPVAYLTNEAWLQGYRFYVDQRVIVPRSFIAELIMERFEPWVDDPMEVTNILELCTGSGCLAVILAEMFPNAKIDATDISRDALEVARRNVADYGYQDRINLIESDLYRKVPRRKYDLIVTNPPYVNADSMKKLPAEYRHEPQMALAGGADGMDLIRKIVAGAGQRLKAHGALIVEVGNEAAHAEAAFPGLELSWMPTSGGDDRVFLLTAEQLQL